MHTCMHIHKYVGRWVYTHICECMQGWNPKVEVSSSASPHLFTEIESLSESGVHRLRQVKLASLPRKSPVPVSCELGLQEVAVPA